MRSSATSSSTRSDSSRSSSFGVRLDLNEVAVCGREKEISHLEGILKDCRSASSRALVTVTGGAGVGKTSLIQSVRDRWCGPIRRTSSSLSASSSSSSAVDPSSSQQKDRTCFFAQGTFQSETTSSRPTYFTVLDTFTDLVQQWSESKDFATEMKVFASQVKPSKKIIEHTVPHLSAMMLDLDDTGKGRLPGLPTSNNMTGVVDQETSGCSFQALKNILQKLLLFLCQGKKERSIVLFLDNVHYACPHSMELIQFVANCNALQKVILIVAYRSEEVPEDHWVTIGFKQLQRQAQCPIHHITIKELDLDGVTSMVTQIMDRKSKEEVVELSQIVYTKTGGTPFYIIQFLQHCCDEGHIVFNVLSYKWEWENQLKAIQDSMQVSDNVAAMAASSMQKLSSTTQQVLMVASCLGDTIPISIMELFFMELKQHEEAKEEVDKHDGNIHLSFLYPSTDVRDLPKILPLLIQTGILNHSGGSTSQFYQWSHDTLQQAAYTSLIRNDEHRLSIHLKLGQLIWMKSKQNPTDEWLIYMAADQFNAVMQYKPHVSYNIDLATLNYQAAQLTIGRSAFFPAAHMLRAARSRLDPQTRWTEQYQLTLDVLCTSSEMEFLIGEHDKAKIAAEEVLQHAKSLEDQFRAQIILLKTLITGSNRNYERCLQQTIEYIALYGEKIDRYPLPTTLLLQRRKLRSTLPQLDQLLEKDENHDMRTLRLLALLRHLTQQALAASNSAGKESWNLSKLASYKSLQLCSEHGISPDTSLALLDAATVYKMEGKLNKSFEYADLALQFCDRYSEEPGGLHAKVKTQYHAAIHPTLRPFHKSLEALLDAYRIAMRTGVMQIATIASMCYGITYICLGLAVGPLESDLDEFSQEATQFGGGPSSIAVFQIMRQTILNLQGDDDENNSIGDPTILKGKGFDPDTMMRHMDSRSKSMTLREVRTFQLLLACIYDDFKTARKLVDQLSAYSLTDVLEPRKHIRLVYLGLASLIISRVRGWRAKCKYGRLGKKILGRFKVETECGSVNAHPILQMLMAEEKPSKALYEKAIKATGRSGLLHHQAFMYERAGLYAANQKDDGGAEFYLSQACALYQDWGACGKVQQMKQRYNFLSNISTSVSSSLQGRTRHEKSLAESLKRFSIEDSTSGT